MAYDVNAESKKGAERLELVAADAADSAAGGQGRGGLQSQVEDALYTAAVVNGLVADDGERQCWATIRSGLSKGLLRPVDLDADAGPRGRRRRWKGEQP